MIEIPFVDAVQARVKPMRVQLTVELRRDNYYLIVDGTKTYPGNPEKWDMMWGGFVVFATFHLRDHVHYKPKQLTTTRVEFKIGSVMDILKNT
jgi:hypothetical protein